MTNRWLMLTLCLVALASSPVYVMWAMAVERYRLYLHEHWPEFLERTMKSAPGPRGGYVSLLYLTRVPAPHADGEPLRRRARVLRYVANGCLGGAAAIIALLSFWKEVIAG